MAWLLDHSPAPDLDPWGERSNHEFLPVPYTTVTPATTSSPTTLASTDASMTINDRCAPGGGSLVVVDTVRTESANGHVEHSFQVALGDIAVVDDAL